MHVLIHSDDPGIGGVAQFDHMFSLGLRAAGFRAGLVQTRQDTPQAEERTRAGVEHHWLDYDTVSEFARTFTRVDEAEALLRRVRPDFILFSDSCPVSNFAGKLAAAALGIPFAARVGFVAPYLAENFAAHLPRLGELYRLSRGIVAVSRENLSLMERLFHLPPERGRVIYSGKSPAFFAPPDPVERRARRERLGVPEDGVLCFTAARLEMVKGYQYQLQAIEALRTTPVWDRLRFAWAGPGSLRGELERVIADRGLTGRVHLLGQCWDVPAWLDAADVFVLPAQAEGLPQAVLEAMAKRLPVISTRVSGIPEALADTGVLLPDPQVDPRGVAEGLARHIAALAADPAHRRAMGDACFARADRHFHAERMVADYIALITGTTSTDEVPTPTPAPSPPPSSPESGLRALLARHALPSTGAVPTFRARLLDPSAMEDAAALDASWNGYRDELAEMAGTLAEVRRVAADLGLPVTLDDREAAMIHVLIRELKPDLVCDLDTGWGEASVVALAALERNGRGRLETLTTAETIAGLPAETAFRCVRPHAAGAARRRSTVGDWRRTMAERSGGERPGLILVAGVTDDVMAEWLVKVAAPNAAGPLLARGVLHGDSRPVDSPAAVYLLSHLQQAGVAPLALGAPASPSPDGKAGGSTAVLLGPPSNAASPEDAAARGAALGRLLDGGGPEPLFPLTSERLHPGSTGAGGWRPDMPPEDRYAAAFLSGVFDRARLGIAELSAIAAHLRAHPGAAPAGLLEDLAGRAHTLDPAAAVLLLEMASLARAGEVVSRLLTMFSAAPPPGAALRHRVALVERVARAGVVGGEG